MRSIITLFFLVLSLSLNIAAASEPLPVVASFSILGDVTRNVGGDRINVSTLVGPDQDAHVFEPSPADIAKIAKARLVVINGLGFEGWISRLTRSSGFKGPVIVASSGVKSRSMPGENNHGTQIDPHAWQNPENVIVYVRNIQKALSQLDPAGEAIYRQNADNYVKQIQNLDDWARGKYAQIPASKRRVITSHDAFGYHGAHYSIEFLAPQGVSTDSEASAKDVARLIKQIKQEHIKAIFMENMSNPKLIEQLSRDAGVQLAGRLYPDALSGKEGEAPTYLELIRTNVQRIIAAMKMN